MKNNLNEYFKAISHYFRVYSLSGLIKAARWTHSSDSSSSSLPSLKFRFCSFGVNSFTQGFSATCRIGHCCVCRQLLFVSETLCNSPTYSKQRMNKISLNRWLVISCVAWKPKIHDDVRLKGVFLEFVYGLLLGNCGYQTDRKKDLWPKRNRTPLAILARQNSKLASLPARENN